MKNRLHWADRPLWVRVGLFGIPSRNAAMRWMKGSLAAVFLLAIAAISLPIALLGNTLLGLAISLFLFFTIVPVTLLGPLWYWLAVQWADEHDGWAQHAGR